MEEAKIKLQNGKWANVSDVTTDKLIFVGRHNGKSQKVLEQLVNYYLMNKVYGEEEFKAVMECMKREEFEHRLRFVHRSY